MIIQRELPFSHASARSGPLWRIPVKDLGGGRFVGSQYMSRVVSRRLQDAVRRERPAATAADPLLSRRARAFVDDREAAG
ncbi:hypothetical protein SAMN05444161_8732 [Rhizobiales bacterium GAS191]|nr:hypothetical protein SAMN05444161_8732 [Rhizobiales bacterium GAS191]